MAAPLPDPLQNQLQDLLDRNRQWAASMESRRPGFFAGLQQQQAPRYMWIGCADSRVPANELVNLEPGELFVHRNVANVVVHSDLNCLSAVQFATDVLKVDHIIVVGHSNCGGVAAALQNRRVGLADNWIRHVADVRNRHRPWLESLPPHRRINALCELNVVDQALNVCHTTVVQDAWQRGQRLTIHGWVYALGNGHLEDLRMTASSNEGLGEVHQAALAAVRARHVGEDDDVR